MFTLEQYPRLEGPEQQEHRISRDSESYHLQDEIETESPDASTLSLEVERQVARSPREPLPLHSIEPSLESTRLSQQGPGYNIENERTSSQHHPRQSSENPLFQIQTRYPNPHEPPPSRPMLDRVPSRSFKVPKRRNDNFKLFLVVWKWEFVNSFLLVVAVFAILATLYPHNGQPVPQWPLSITINALLSIYAVWFRASVIFVTAAGIGQLQWQWFSSE